MRGRSQKKKPGTENVLVGTGLKWVSVGYLVCKAAKTWPSTSPVGEHSP